MTSGFGNGSKKELAFKNTWLKKRGYHKYTKKREIRKKRCLLNIILLKQILRGKNECKNWHVKMNENVVFRVGKLSKL